MSTSPPRRRCTARWDLAWCEHHPRLPRRWPSHRTGHVCRRQSPQPCRPTPGRCRYVLYEARVVCCRLRTHEPAPGSGDIHPVTAASHGPLTADATRW